MKKITFFGNLYAADPSKKGPSGSSEGEGARFGLLCIALFTLQCNAKASCRHAAGSSGARGTPCGDGRDDATSEAVTRDGILIMGQHKNCALAHGK